MDTKIRSRETVHFDLEKIQDTHAAFNAETGDYTIVVDGTYIIVKPCKAGETIKNPKLVTKIQETGPIHTVEWKFK